MCTQHNIVQQHSLYMWRDYRASFTYGRTNFGSCLDIQFYARRKQKTSPLERSMSVSLEFEIWCTVFNGPWGCLELYAQMDEFADSGHSQLTATIFCLLKLLHWKCYLRHISYEGGCKLFASTWSIKFVQSWLCPSICTLMITGFKFARQDIFQSHVWKLANMSPTSTFFFYYYTYHKFWRLPVTYAHMYMHRCTVGRESLLQL